MVDPGLVRDADCSADGLTRTGFVAWFGTVVARNVVGVTPTPIATWHVARDGPAAAVNFLALVSASLGKIACDVMLMASTEFAEGSEPFVPGRGAGSTLPQKRNPISSELISAAAKATREHAG